MKLAASFLPAIFWVFYTISKSIAVFRFAPLYGYRIYNSLPLPLAVVQSILFVFFVIVLTLIWRGDWKLLAFASVIWVCAAAEFFLLIQTGEEVSLNMIWGYLCAQYLAFFAAVVSFEKICSKVKPLLYCVGQILFIGHLLTGLWAFSLSGYQFWVNLLKTV